MIKKCEWCAKEFKYKMITAKFCSNLCEAKKYYYSHKQKPEKLGKCKRCGQNIVKRNRKNTKYCSKECQKAQWFKDNKYIKIKIKKCCWCNKEFQSAYNKPNQACCSKICGKHYDYYKNHPYLIYTCCVYCNKKIHSKISGTKFCSRICQKKQYKIDNPEKFRMKKLKRRELEKKLDSSFTIEDDKYIMCLFKYKCFNCNKSKHLCIDHIYPLSRGHALTRKNACILCKHCNSSKGNKNPEDFYTAEKLITLFKTIEA